LISGLLILAATGGTETVTAMNLSKTSLKKNTKPLMLAAKQRDLRPGRVSRE
jgi:hypothetical protein